MARENTIRLSFKTSIKIAFLVSLAGLLSAILVKERYLLLLSLINFLLSLYIIKAYR